VLLVGSSVTDSAGIRWERLADSSASERYRWTVTREQQGTRAVADTVPLQLHQVTRESGAMAWGRAGVPLAWSRIIRSEVTSTVRQRTVQAVVDQRIAVHRGE
jgi:hypothetical protein